MKNHWLNHIIVVDFSEWDSEDYEFYPAKIQTGDTVDEGETIPWMGVDVYHIECRRDMTHIIAFCRENRIYTFFPIVDGLAKYQKVDE